ncbi:unnamed protein product [Sphenostylis stenocarpa]|uniref:Uncharacterized protein n=1 Tax=Sphenostylis stenocarpa TaxID=92480 RepID=A0AA86VYJ6_9FABA|nr:unnamed protein product [Sphenostylis stenocarpa]
MNHVPSIGDMVVLKVCFVLLFLLGTSSASSRLSQVGLLIKSDSHHHSTDEPSEDTPGNRVSKRTNDTCMCATFHMQYAENNENITIHCSINKHLQEHFSLHSKNEDGGFEQQDQQHDGGKGVLRATFPCGDFYG